MTTELQRRAVRHATYMRACSDALRRARRIIADPEKYSADHCRDAAGCVTEYMACGDGHGDDDGYGTHDITPVKWSLADALGCVCDAPNRLSAIHMRITQEMEREAGSAQLSHAEALALIDRLIERYAAQVAVSEAKAQ